MCFIISQDEKTINEWAKKRIVWKQVDVGPDGSVISPFRWFEWQTGVVKAKGNCWRRRSIAQNGIYVYKSKADAMYEEYDFTVGAWVKALFKTYYAKPQNFGALLRLAVDPADFLYCNRKGDIATYRKVTVLEVQPYLDWY